jgi:hypothetical protein
VLNPADIEIKRARTGYPRTQSCGVWSAALVHTGSWRRIWLFNLTIAKSGSAPSPLSRVRTHARELKGFLSSVTCAGATTARLEESRNVGELAGEVGDVAVLGDAGQVRSGLVQAGADLVELASRSAAHDGGRFKAVDLRDSSSALCHSRPRGPHRVPCSS